MLVAPDAWTDTICIFLLPSDARSASVLRPVVLSTSTGWEHSELGLGELGDGRPGPDAPDRTDLTDNRCRRRPCIASGQRHNCADGDRLEPLLAWRSPATKLCVRISRLGQLAGRLGRLHFHVAAR